VSVAPEAVPARTLTVLHVAEMSGPARSLLDRISWLAEVGEVELVVPGPGPAADLYADVANVTRLDYRALTLPRSPAQAAALARGWRREVSSFRGRIRATRPDLVLCATATLPAALFAARRERVPAILYATEVLVTGRSPLRRLAGRALARAVGSAASAVAASSELVATQYPRSKTTVIPPPIPDAFGGGDGPGFRRRHGIPPDAPLVLGVGSLSAGRGQDVLLDAVARVRRRLPEVGCALVGVPFARTVDLEYERRLRRIAATLDTSPRTGDSGGSPAIAFCGYEPRMEDAYAAATVVVNPARFPEPFGRVACEGLAASRPVVATRVGAIPGILKDGETALLVPPEDPLALATAIEAMLREPERARALAEAGRRDVLERFAPERSLVSFKSLVRATLHPGRAGRESPAP